MEQGGLRFFQVFEGLLKKRTAPILSSASVILMIALYSVGSAFRGDT
jgi:hypothetical protein